MDPHTARCLQLSTSIRMPFHPYRQHRFPDSINRSRFPVNAPVQQMRPGPQRAATLPANSWPPTPINVYQQPYTPTATPISGYSPSSYHVSPSQASASSAKTEPSFFPSAGSPFEDAWDSSFRTDTKQMKHEGLGMSFLDQDQDFGPITFSATTENFEDLIRLSDNEPWDIGNPMSPDRRSLSSASSGDGVSDFADIPEMCSMPMLSSDVSSGLEMPTVEEDITTDFVHNRRSRSTSRAPAPRASSNRRYRRSPYSIDHTRSSSVMSTSSSNIPSMPLSLPTTQCCSPVEECQDDFILGDFNGLGAAPIFNSGATNFDHFYHGEPLVAPKPIYSCDSLFLSSSFEEAMFDNPPHSILPSSGLLGDNGQPNSSCNNHADYADEPDLFGPLSEEQSVPSEEDMKPEDPDLQPSEQELRFEGDLYTPKFVRGHGNKREGYCGLCKPGRWLVLKNSAFWYDKSFTHGISAATGQPFDAPKETRRMSGNPDVWEGLCGTCDEWIALISNKKKGTTWFRHAYKCHTHQKAKDAPKRKRDHSNNKPAKAKYLDNACMASGLQGNGEALGKTIPALQTIHALL